MTSIIAISERFAISDTDDDGLGFILFWDLLRLGGRSL